LVNYIIFSKQVLDLPHIMSPTLRV